MSENVPICVCFEFVICFFSVFVGVKSLCVFFVSENVLMYLVVYDLNLCSIFFKCVRLR